ncbi:MAG TPA: hypothetical protein VJI13_00835 [Candidatus Norongarragalinales archaeon]|nr:hypothetical protein [Candidatus Norongarragalinales archaeon]
MDFKILVAGLILVVAALIVSVNAIELKTSEDSISIQSTEGKLFAYVKNTASERRSLYLSVDGNKLSAFVEPYSTTVAPGATGGAFIRVTAPDCFRGSEVVEIFAQLCSSTGCEVAKRKVIAYVEPAKICSSYIEGYAPTNQFISGTASGSADPFHVNTIDPKRSRLVFSESFDPTAYALRITGGESCEKVKRGEVGRVRLTVSNRGAAGNFDMRVVTDSSIDAFPSKDYIALQRGSSDEVSVDIRPSLEAAAVRQYVTLQVLHLDELVAEKDVCIDLFDDFKTAIFAPSTVTGRTTKDMAIQLEVVNDGSTLQHYSFFASNNEIQNYLTVDPQSFTLKPGAKKIVDVNVDTSKLSPGTYRIQYLAQSEESEETSETVLKVEKETGLIQTSGNVEMEFENQQKDNVLTVIATIRNEGDAHLEDATPEVKGLPPGWEVKGLDPLSIRAHGTAIVEFQIISNSQEDALPILVLMQDGKTIASQKLPSISGKAGGFTGMFTLNSQNVVLALIIIAGVLVFLMTGRRSEELDSHSGGHGHLESIKHEASGHDPRQH